MRVKFSDMPDEKSFEDYPDGTEFALDDRPRKYNESTGKFVKPGDPGYDELPELIIP